MPRVPPARRVARAGRRARSGPRSATRSTGDARCPASATRAARVLVVGIGTRRRTAATAPAGCSPATVPATGSSRRSIAPGFANQPTSVAADDGLELHDAYVAAAVRCAPPANKPTPEERDRCLPFLERELALLAGVRVSSCSVASRTTPLARLLAAAGYAVPGATPEVRARRRGRDRPVRRARLLPPEPAEHVHRASSPSRCSTPFFSGPGRWPAR